MKEPEPPMRFDLMFCAAILGASLILAGWCNGQSGRYQPGAGEAGRFDTVDGEWQVYKDGKWTSSFGGR